MTASQILCGEKSDLEQKIVLPAHATGCFAHYDSDIVLAVRGFDGVGDWMLHVGSAIY